MSLLYILYIDTLYVSIGYVEPYICLYVPRRPPTPDPVLRLFPSSTEGPEHASANMLLKPAVYSFITLPGHAFNLCSPFTSTPEHASAKLLKKQAVYTPYTVNG